MGMSASQARLLTITSRMNDIEFKSQQVANVKIRLADESDAVAQKYTDALNKSKLTFKQYNNGDVSNVPLDGKSLFAAANGNAAGAAYDLGYRLCDSKGNILSNDKLKNLTATQIYDMIESGQFRLDKVKDGKKEEISVSSDVGLAITSDDSTKIAAAEAEYNAATAKINRKEKQLDQQMKTLDTEHSALKTEQDSIKSLIKDNVDKSFNLFS